MIIPSLIPAAALPGRSDAQAPPNVVILFADDLGYGDLGCYGHPTIRTPRLDRMAREGVRLTSFYAAPSCSPSRTALLTGRYPPRSGIFRVLGPDDALGMPESEVTLAEALRERGYRTQAIGKWHLGHADERHFPTANGFDAYFGLLYSNDMMPPWVETRKPLRLYRGVEPVEHPVDQSTLTRRYTEEAARFIRESKGRPFFLYLAYAMTHVPLAASEGFAGRSRAGLYGDAVEEIDWSAGRILEVLEEEGLAGNTLVVFTSDNGPWMEMPERMFRGGIIQRWDAGSAGLLRGSKGSTWEGGVRVPCIARWPGRLPAGRIADGIVSSLDLYTTAVELAGGEAPRDRPVDGLNVLAHLEGKGPSPRREFFYFAGRRLEAVREGKWKLRLAGQPGAGAKKKDREPQPELYDLDADPSERFDAAARHPELVERLRDRIEAFQREVEPAGTGR